MAATRRRLATDASRQALIDGARECFTTLGYEATSVQELTSRAQMSKGGFYRHFPDKKAAFVDVFVERLTAAAALIAAAQDSLPGAPRGDGVRIASTAVIEFATLSVTDPVHRELLRQAPEVLGETLYRAVDDEYVLRPLVALLRSLAARDELLPGLPLETTGALLLHVMCAGNTLIARSDDRTVELGDVLTATAAMLSGLIAPDLRPQPHQLHKEN